MNLSDLIDLGVLGDLLEVGALGFVAGVLLPFGFRLIGYVIDTVKVVIGREEI